MAGGSVAWLPALFHTTMKPTQILHTITLGAIFGTMLLPFIWAGERGQKISGTSEHILSSATQSLTISASKRWVVLVDLPSQKVYEVKGADVKLEQDGSITLVGKGFGGYVRPSLKAPDGRTQWDGEWFRKLPNGKTEQHPLTKLSGM